MTKRLNLEFIKSKKKKKRKETVINRLRIGHINTAVI